MIGQARSSFRSLLRAWIFGYAFLAVVLSTVFFVSYADNEVNRHLHLAEDMIQLYSDDTVSIEFGRHNVVYVQDALQRLAHLLDAKKARVRGIDGVIAESTEKTEIGTRPPMTPSGTRVLSAMIREHSSGERLGTLEVLVDKSSLMGSALRAAFIPAITFLAGLVLLSVFVVRSLRRRLIRPISQLLTGSEVPEAQIERWPSEIYDLSERLHEALQERDFAMVGQFSSGILHDIKTRIHSINSAKEMIDELPPDSAKKFSRLEGLYRACSFHIPPVRSLIESTLDGSRQIEINANSCDVAATLKGVVSQHQDYAEKRGVRVELADGIDGLVAEHDGLQLDRALSNILKNGIEAFDQTEIGEKRVLISARREASSIEICFEDTGPGLTTAPNDLLKSIRTTKVHGTGLGLLVTRKIVEGHGGKLSAGKSERLNGARFRVTLPSGGAL